MTLEMSDDLKAKLQETIKRTKLAEARLAQIQAELARNQAELARNQAELARKETNLRAFARNQRQTSLQIAISTPNNQVTMTKKRSHVDNVVRLSESNKRHTTRPPPKVGLLFPVPTERTALPNINAHPDDVWCPRDLFLATVETLARDLIRASSRNVEQYLRWLFYMEPYNNDACTKLVIDDFTRNLASHAFVDTESKYHKPKYTVHYALSVDENNGCVLTPKIHFREYSTMLTNRVTPNIDNVLRKLSRIQNTPHYIALTWWKCVEGIQDICWVKRHHQRSWWASRPTLHGFRRWVPFKYPGSNCPQTEPAMMDNLLSAYTRAKRQLQVLRDVTNIPLDVSKIIVSYNDLEIVELFPSYTINAQLRS